MTLKVLRYRCIQANHTPKYLGTETLADDSRPRNVTEAQHNYAIYSRCSTEQWAVATMNMSPGWDRSSSGIGYTGITKLRQTLDKICIRVFVNLSSVLELISSYEHF